MRRSHTPVLVAVAALVLTGLALLGAGGCGEKIAIPQPEGVFGLREYTVYLTTTVDDPRKVLQVQGNLYLLAGDALHKRDIYLEEQATVTGLADPTALCQEPDSNRIMVWEQGTHTVRTFTRDLQPLGAVALPEVGRVTSMAVSPLGAEADPDAVTFLYLADPDAAIVHRYAVDAYGGLLPFGKLAANRGNGVRDVKKPIGLARDAADHVLVCDADSLRHWIIRFDPTPDEADADLRGTPALFLPFPRCAPVPAADEYVLGNAPGCGQEDWVPGASDSLGAFDTPSTVVVAGAGRIYVADTGNDRIQAFSAYGEYDLSFGSSQDAPGPTSISVYDFKYGPGATDYYYGALVFAVLPDGGRVRSYISTEYSDFLNRQPRPPE